MLVAQNDYTNFETQEAAHADFATVNNRAAVEWCLFGHYDSHDLEGDVKTTLPYQKCNSKCVAIKSALDDGVWTSADNFDWCEFEGGNFTKDAESCIDCLYNTPTLTILGNSEFTFMRVPAWEGR
jgi:hypothetical protein